MIWWVCETPERKGKMIKFNGVCFHCYFYMEWRNIMILISMVLNDVATNDVMWFVAMPTERFCLSLYVVCMQVCNVIHIEHPKKRVRYDTIQIWSQNNEQKRRMAKDIPHLLCRLNAQSHCPFMEVGYFFTTELL